MMRDRTAANRGIEHIAGWLTATCLAAGSAKAADPSIEALSIFKSQCAGALEPFNAGLKKANAEGWSDAAANTNPVIAALKSNYGDAQKYSSVHVLQNPELGERYVLAYIEGDAKTIGEVTVPAMNICRLIDTQATAPLDTTKFETEFDPLASPQYQSFVTIRQVYFASTDAPPIPKYPLIDGRPKTDIGLMGWVLTASKFAK